MLLLQLSAVTLPGALAPLAATAFVLGGVALIVSGLRVKHELVLRRVDLIRPRTAAPEARFVHWTETTIFRAPMHGLSEFEQHEIVRRGTALGVRADRAVLYFTGLRVALTLILATLAWVWASHVAALAASRIAPLAVATIMAICGWFVPIVLVRVWYAKRIKAVTAGLPDALELLVVCVEAGLSLEDGFDRVVRELSRAQPELADELALTSADLKILPSRDQALANLATRIDVPSVRSVTATLSQTLRYGTPLAHALRVVAAGMRSDSLTSLEERANKLPALLTLPVMLFIMPTIFLIVGGPVALRLFDMFHR